MGVQVEQLSSQTETKPSKTSYINELKEELKKVTWTTKDELIGFTKIVVGATFALGIGIYGVDLLIKGFLKGFGALIHLIFG
ncbi:MAG TPA: preprotein translocase subunit SecE [Rhabdochlamydiaceae bacterium]|jgi:preprotein translocase subunit SecE|nr:preprotein translocase subunit SecE [Rhabdochlamydiaceae bacterium]